MASHRIHSVRPHAARRNHFLLGLTAFTFCAYDASAAITFDLRASGIDGGFGTLQDGKNVVVGGSAAGTVSLQIWAQITNAAPTNNVFGIQSMLGSIKSSSGGGTAPVVGSLSGMIIEVPFGNQASFGTVGELTVPGDGILDVGSNATTVNTAFPKARKDPTSGGTQVGSVFYASNLDPAGATVQAITDGHEFLMGTFTFSISSFVSSAGTFSLNWAIPAFTTPANRGQIASWTDGTGLNKTGNAFSEMFVGGAVNFTIGTLLETSWTSNTGGSWNDTTNWSNGVANGITFDATFGSAITGPAVVTVDGDKTLSKLILDSTNAYSLTQGSGGTLSVGGSIHAAAGSHTIAVPMNLPAANTAVTVANASDTLAVSGAVSGTGGITKTGPGTLQLSGTNSYAGATTVNAGTVELNSPGGNPIPGNATVAGGTLRLLQSEQIADTAVLNVVGGTFDLAGQNETVSSVLMTAGEIAGPGTLTSATSIELQAGSVSATLAGPAGLNKTSGGKVTLSGANTYLGTTEVDAGVLELNTTGGNAVPGNVTIDGGTLRLLQSEQIGNAGNLVANGGLFDLGAHSETVNEVQVSGGTIIGTGVLTSLAGFTMLSGNAVVNLAGNVGLTKTTGGSANLFGANTYTGATTVQAGSLQLNTTGANSIVGNVEVQAGTLRLLQSNQIADTSNVHLGKIGAVLDLGANAETVNHVRLEQGSITGSGVLTSLSDFALENGSVSARLAGNVGMTKTTAGTVTLAGANTYTGQTQVNGGVLQLNATGGNAILGNVAVSGATLRLQQSHQIADSAGVNLVNATLDLSSHSETVNSVSLAGGAIMGSGTLTSLTDYMLEGGSVSARLAGNAGLIKNSGTPATLSAANTYTGLTTVNEGTLDLNATGTNAISGNVSIAGGQLRLVQSDQIADTASVTIANGGAGIGNFTLGFNTAETVAGVRLISGTITGTGTLTSLSDFEIESGIASARLAGEVGLTKTTGGTASLTGQNTYTGPTRVNAGSLNIAGQTHSTSFTVEDDATLGLVGVTLNLITGSLRANAGGSIEYTGATVNGGFLRGPGTHTVVAGSTLNLNGVTSFNSTTLTQNGTANLTNVSNGGLITNGAELNWDGGGNSSSGRLTVNSTANVRDWTNDGVVTVNSGGVLASTGSDLVSGGGSRITIHDGGQLSIETGRSLDLQGSLLVNNGTISGRTEVYYGGTAKGGGVFGSVAVFDGGKFSPGNSPGTATINGTYEWGAGGSVDFEIFDALGVAGSTTGWDLTKVIGPDGFLDIAAGTTANSRFTIHVASNDASNALPVLNFDSSLSYQWLMVDTTQGVTGFDPAEIAIDASRFLNPLDGGAFSVATDGSKLFLNYSPIPEPSSAVLLMASLGVLGLRRSRRK